MGKQRVETLQIINALQRGAIWEKHPAVLMWKGFEEALIRYGFVICHEWQRRGYKDTVYEQLFNRSEDPLIDNVQMPKWLGDDRLHLSHRSNLLRKNETYYRKFGWTETPDFSYFWPMQWGY